MTTDWTLQDLLRPEITVQGNADAIRVRGLTADSREVRSGYIYAALPGQKFHGKMFVQDALRNGAVAVLCGADVNASAFQMGDVPLLVSPTPRRTFAKLAAKFFRAAPETVVTVTGTNGKTSVVHYVQELWTMLGIKGASLGTLGVVSPGRVRDGRMTTPDPINLHAELADLAAIGITHLAMEASSHGLDQRRLDGLKVKAAAFTNLTHDHLDYHTDMDGYYEAKARLFTELLVTDGTAVINADKEYGQRLIKDAAARDDVRVLEYGRNGKDIRIVEQTSKPLGQDVVIDMLGVRRSLTLNLVGGFQAHNVCAALGLVHASLPEVKIEDLLALLPRLTAPRGRLQFVEGHKKGAGVYVDYAHTPDALEHILKALRAHTEKRLIVVFGCGGDRDKSKRPVMGRLAAELADVAIVTDDNPRSENADTIRREILAASPGALNIGDRAEAIKQAVDMAEKGDIVIIAGKGHEQGQLVGGIAHPFDDVEVTKHAMV